jgi:diacylglycerol O-acyltransferase / wax synthase
MQQLTALDAWFINETATSFQHICDILPFEAGDSGLSIGDLRRTVEQRLHLLPPLRRRLIEVPFGMDEPYWIEDPDFDLSNHMHEASLPAPGNDRQLAELTASIAGRPLDRSRPLWELYLVHGLASSDGLRRQALIKKFHHAAVDGASGLEVTGILLDPTPEPRDIPPPAEAWVPDRPPEQGEMLMRGFAGMATRPLKMMEVQQRLLETLPRPGQAITSPTGDQQGDGGFLSAPDGPAPATPLNVKVTADRSVAFGHATLDTVKAVKNAFGVTVNDVIITVCAAALRRWLLARDALPDKPLLVAVPISVRTEEERGRFGNRVSILIATLPTHLADPVERLRAAHEAMQVAKEQHNAVGANLLGDIGEFAMPALQARASRVTAQMELPDDPIRWNVSVSNLPGSRVPLYLAGHRLLGDYPVGMVSNNQALMITVASYTNVVGFGLVSDPHAVPDLWGLLDMLMDALGELAARAASG